jgi:hypothetical protein
VFYDACVPLILCSIERSLAVAVCTWEDTQFYGGPTSLLRESCLLTVETVRELVVQ